LLLNLQNEPCELKTQACEPGDLYMSSKGQYWLIVAVKNGRAALIVYDQNGIPTAVQTYGSSYIESNKRRVGRVEIPTLEVEWEPNL
jgi:hypothetical protein